MTHEEAMRKVVEEGYQLRLRKHHDYTGKPIMRKGLAGVLIRLQDKIDRLESILAKGSVAVSDETVRDTMLDIHCYGTIGVMLCDGTFSLPASWEE